jgi:hypothetical protein
VYGFGLIFCVWLVAAGFIVARIFFCGEDAERPGYIPPPTGDITFQHEYDLVLITATEPHDIVYVEFVSTDDTDYGYAHYMHNDIWRSVQLTGANFSLKDKKDLNQYVSTVEAGFVLANTVFKIAVPEIYTNMVIRAEADFTKFGGATPLPTAVLQRNNTIEKCYAALLKGYNTAIFNADLGKYGINTDWLMYWDEDWQFYHLDKTTLEREHPKYDAHEFMGSIRASGNRGGTVSYYSAISILEERQGVRTISFSSGEKRQALALKNEAYFEKYLHTGARVEGSLVLSRSDAGVGVYLRVYPD